MRKIDYQIIDKANSKKLTEFLCQERQLLLPQVELITHMEMALDELIDITGRAAIEAVLTLSAQEVAGAKHPGKKAGEIRWYGRQSTTVPLSNRKLRVDKPRLRRKGISSGKEVEIPAYEAIYPARPPRRSAGQAKSQKAWPVTPSMPSRNRRRRMAERSTRRPWEA